MMRPMLRVHGSLCLILLILAAACGGGDDDMSASDAAPGRDAADPSERDAAAPDAPDAVDPRFSFIVIPDTQIEIVYEVEHFTNRLDWILQQRDALDIRFVLHTGDMVDWDTDDHRHYARASDALEVLDEAELPYAIALGNHDTAVVCEGGSACPGNANANLRDTTTFNSYFPPERFSALAETRTPGRIDNSVHTFRAGGLDWLVLSLELWARDEVVDWADEVLGQYPDHNVIVITHSHLTGGGDIRADNGGYGDNSPRSIFDEVLSQHANVRLVFSGHEGQAAFREDTAAAGTTIYQFLNAFHDGDTNPTRIVEVDTEAGTLDTRVYAPFTDEEREGPGTSVQLDGIEWVR